MRTAKLTVRLPVSAIEFIKWYAESHGLSVSELIDRYIDCLQASQRNAPLHPEIQKITGIIPHDIDAKTIFYEHLLEKH